MIYKKKIILYSFVCFVGLISLSWVCSLRQITMNFERKIERERERDMSNETFTQKIVYCHLILIFMRSSHAVKSNKTIPSALFIQLRTYQLWQQIFKSAIEIAEENLYEVKSWRRRKKKAIHILTQLTSVRLVHGTSVTLWCPTNQFDCCALKINKSFAIAM